LKKASSNIPGVLALNTRNINALRRLSGCSSWLTIFPYLREPFGVVSVDRLSAEGSYPPGGRFLGVGRVGAKKASPANLTEMPEPESVIVVDTARRDLRHVDSPVSLQPRAAQENAMRNLISNRTNSNDLGCRQVRQFVAVKNGLQDALRASFSFFRHADEALAGYLASFERRIKPATAQATAVPAAPTADRQMPATHMSRTLGDCGPQGRFDRPASWHSARVPHASVGTR
jgi:hypothetical protein